MRSDMAASRTTISLPVELREKLRALANKRGVSIAALIEDLLSNDTRTLTPDELWELRGRPKPTILGMASSKGLPPIDWNADFHPEPRTWRSS
jgi:hypothetical protein